MAARLPFGGKFYPAKERKYRETVFFVHFYRGNQRMLRRHLLVVNQLGYDAFAFDLVSSFSLKTPPLTADRRIGYKHVYAEQIETLLDLVPGPKIIYSFSNPTAAAIEAMARRGCRDIVALIADSGPAAHFVKSVYNLYSKASDFAPLPVRLAAVPALCALWSPTLHRDLHPQLETFPQGFPVLSIRGWKDELISPSSIDAVFEPHRNLAWRKLALPQAEHLKGLKDFRDDYLAGLIPFLKDVSTPLEAK